MSALSIIAAIGQNRELGKDNDLLWNIPRDMNRFKQMTAGHTVVMGRKTFDSLWIKPLPKRKNIVLTSSADLGYSNVQIVHSLPEILDAVKGDGEVFVIGGAKIYELLLPYCSRMYITYVHSTFDADTYFPEFELSQWEEAFREDIVDDSEAGVNYSFVNLDRI